MCIWYTVHPFPGSGMNDIGDVERVKLRKLVKHLDIGLALCLVCFIATIVVCVVSFTMGNSGLYIVSICEIPILGVMGFFLLAGMQVSRGATQICRTTHPHDYALNQIEDNESPAFTRTSNLFSHRSDASYSDTASQTSQSNSSAVSSPRSARHTISTALQSFRNNPLSFIRPPPFAYPSPRLALQLCITYVTIQTFFVCILVVLGVLTPFIMEEYYYTEAYCEKLSTTYDPMIGGNIYSTETYDQCMSFNERVYQIGLAFLSFTGSTVLCTMWSVVTCGLMINKLGKAVSSNLPPTLYMMVQRTPQSQPFLIPYITHTPPNNSVPNSLANSTSSITPHTNANSSNHTNHSNNNTNTNNNNNNNTNTNTNNHNYNNTNNHNNNNINANINNNHNRSNNPRNSNHNNNNNNNRSPAIIEMGTEIEENPENEISLPNRYAQQNNNNYNNNNNNNNNNNFNNINNNNRLQNLHKIQR